MFIGLSFCDIVYRMHAFEVVLIGPSFDIHHVFYITLSDNIVIQWDK